MNDFSSKTTLCITHVDESKNQKDTGNRCARIRSLKLMRSALAGIPIVSQGYVHTCHEKGAIVIPTPSMMIRSLPTKTRGLDAAGSTGYGVAALAATMHQSTSSGGHHLLFSNMFVLLCGAFSAGKRADIHLLLKEGGAELLSNPAAAVAKLKVLSSSTTDKRSPQQNAVKVLLLCDDSSSTSSMNVIPAMLEMEAKTTLDSSHAESLLVVNSSWLFDSITCGRPLDIRFFQPSAKKAKELWSEMMCKRTRM
jgi:hypothetical protein